MSAAIRLVEEARARSRAPLERRELTAHLLVGAPLLAFAGLLVAVGLDEPLDATDVLLFVVAAALMGRLQFETGSGFMNPAQLIFVPMLSSCRWRSCRSSSPQRCCSTACPRCSRAGCIRSGCPASSATGGSR